MGYICRCGCCFDKQGPYDAHLLTCKYVNWHLPPIGWFKINTDGSCKHENPTDKHPKGLCGGGGIVRDELGDVKAAFYDYFRMGDPTLAELSALYRSLSIVLQAKIKKAIIELDCLILIDAIDISLKKSILLARGASRLSLNCKGWLPLEVARMFGCHWLEPILDPNYDLPTTVFPPSSYLSLPLTSILNIAKTVGLQCSAIASEDADICSVCLERSCTVAAEGCAHELCVRCALYLCLTSNIPSESLTPPGSIPCPLCRHGILSFLKLPGSSAMEIKLPLSLTLCTPCMLHTRDQDTSETATSPDTRKGKCSDSISSDIICPVTCSLFPFVAIPLCTCNEGPCPNFDSGESECPDGCSQSLSNEPGKMDGMRLDKTTCSSMFWGRRSCSRENQCNAEINA
ncbi:hypothetical protein CASFOL_008328 [Castilleja foliolosa]|uniref:RING-type E3 ubiquitin transferase n=1 Tax=Castilleja foliolosa TaxID=1961234 RepID=A0ABD3DYN4_9LAMI